MILSIFFFEMVFFISIALRYMYSIIAKIQLRSVVKHPQVNEWKTEDNGTPLMNTSSSVIFT